MKKQKTKNKMVIQIAMNIAVIAVILLLLNLNLLVYPIENLHTRNGNIKFEWIGLGNAKLADNPQFISYTEIRRDNPVVELKPGRYYWQAGLGRTHTFVVESEVTVTVTPESRGNETKYRIENKGNTRILLNILGMITGRIVLEPSAVTYQENVSDIEKIEALQK